LTHGVGIAPRCLTDAMARPDSEAMSGSSDIRDARLSPLERKQCSRCGAYCHNADMSCWFCKRQFLQSEGEPLRPGQFSMATLFGVMTTVAVGLGLLMFSPPLAVIVYFFCALAAVRMWVVEGIRAAYGSPRRTGHFVLHFAASFGLAVLAAFSWFILLFIGFVIAGMRADGLDLELWPVGGGFVLGLILAAWILWLTRRVPMAE